MGHFVPDGVFDLVFETSFVVAEHGDRAFEDGDFVRSNFRIAIITLRQRQAFVQAEERFVAAEFELLPLLWRRVVCPRDGHIFEQPLDIFLRQLVKRLTDQIFKLLNGDFYHGSIVTDTRLGLDIERRARDDGANRNMKYGVLQIFSIVRAGYF